MLELYHNAASSCSQKVRLVLAEKGLEFTSHAIDLVGGEQHDPAYVKLNPGHVVPTLVHDGAVLVESSLINEYLDEEFFEPPMRPVDSLGRHAARLWIKRIDEKVHPFAAVFTYAIGPRPMILQQPAEVREANLAAIPDPVRRAERRSVLEHGVEAPEFARALGRFVEFVDDMDAALASQEWLTGDAFGLADAAALPYVLRMEHLAMDPLLAAEARPRVADWLARVKARKSYDIALTQWLPQGVIDLFRANGQAVWGQVEKLLAR